MAKQSINTIKNWFRTGLKPTQQQFWDWLDSYRHKDDDVLAADIDGLQELLDTKVDKKDFVEPGIWDSEEAYVYDAEQQQYVSYSNPASEDPQFKSEGFYRLLADTSAGESPETHPAKWVYQGQTIGDIAIEDVIGLIEVLNDHASDIEINNAKVGITQTQANNITANNKAIHKDKAAEIFGITEKTALVDDDLFIIEDSENGNVKKKVKKSSVGSGSGGVVSNFLLQLSTNPTYNSDNTIKILKQEYISDPTKYFEQRFEYTDGVVTKIEIKDDMTSEWVQKTNLFSNGLLVKPTITDITAWTIT